MVGVFLCFKKKYLCCEKSTMNKTELTLRIKESVQLADASAQVILYGSQARGTATKNSDWDILILLNKPNVTIKDEQEFRHKLYEIELESGELISTYVYSLIDWETKLSVTPLYKNIKREGVYI